MSNGHVAELLHLRQVLQAKDVGHLLYEMQRELAAGAEIRGGVYKAREWQEVQRLVFRQSELYTEAFISGA